METVNDTNNNVVNEQNTPNNKIEPFSDFFKRLELSHLESEKNLNVIRNEVSVVNYKLINAQDDTYNKFKILVDAKDKYVLSVIQNQQEEINKLQTELQNSSRLPSIVEVVNNRADNLLTDTPTTDTPTTDTPTTDTPTTDTPTTDTPTTDTPTNNV